MRLLCTLLLTLWTSLVAAQSLPTNEAPLADVLVRVPPLEPDVALGTFVLQHGFSLELVASEPDVADPVDACFDERGRMYVAEMRGYPYSEEVRPQQPEPIGRPNAGVIRLLEDTTGDGRFDRSVVFVKDISWPTSACCYDGGVFVIAPPHLYYFKDTDGDDMADVREIRFTGFSRANVQGLANNLKWGLDGRIYASGGTNGGDLARGEEMLGHLRSRDFCVDPATMDVEFVTGGRQFGHCFDDWGHRFVCSNSNHIQHVLYEQRYLTRGGLVSISDPIRSIAAEGPAAPVFRQSPAEPWRIVRTRRRAADPTYQQRLPPTELVPTGFFTSATGITVYRGDAYPDEFRGNVFIGDVGGNLVHRKTLTPAGASFSARRADEGVEFLTSTDTWFRPVNFVNAPDGCLYILDMYRETIEHPASIPEDIKAHLDLESGYDRGRIWRLVPPDWTYARPERLDRMTPAELAGQLTSMNAWQRETAHRLLLERRNTLPEGGLRSLLPASLPVQGRVHALSLLKSLGELGSDDLTVAAGDASPQVRRQAVRLAEELLSASDAASRAPLATIIRERLTETDAGVQFQAALSLWLLRGPEVSTAIRQALQRDTLDADVSTALLLSIGEQRAEVASALLQDTQSPSAASQEFLAELLRGIGTGGTDDQARSLIERLVTPSAAPSALDRLMALGTGLHRRGTSLSAVLADAETPDAVHTSFHKLFTAAQRTTLDQQAPVAERVHTARTLAFGDSQLLLDVVPHALTPQAPVALQQAVLEAAAAHPGDEPIMLALIEWPGLSPPLRALLVDGLLRNRSRSAALLDALAAHNIQPQEIIAEHRQALLQHPQSSVRDRAESVLSSLIPADRAQVIADYDAALASAGDASSGRGVFEKRCATCHRLGDTGHAVGPDFASVQNKSDRDLLIAILDPNREAQPNFTSYTALMTDGRVFAGLIAKETADALTLRRAEGKEDVVLRRDIELLKSSGVSLMPVGIEKDVTPQDLADVIAFIRSSINATPTKNTQP